MQYGLPDLEELRSWAQIDAKRLTIDNETEFVQPEVLTHVLAVSAMTSLATVVELLMAMDSEIIVSFFLRLILQVCLINMFSLCP